MYYFAYMLWYNDCLNIFYSRILHRVLYSSLECCSTIISIDGSSILNCRGSLRIFRVSSCSIIAPPRVDKGYSWHHRIYSDGILLSQFSYSTWSIWESVVSTSDKFIQLCRRNHVHNFSGWYSIQSRLFIQS